MTSFRFSICFTLSLAWILSAFFTNPQVIAEQKAKTKASAKIGYPSFLSPHSSPIAIHGDQVFVVNTPSDTVDVIDKKNQKIVERINVGVDPVSVAVRPDGKEVWVSNHISDSVSIIDTVSSEWSAGLAKFYNSLNKDARLGLDLAEVKKNRPEIASLLKAHAAKSKDQR